MSTIIPLHVPRDAEDTAAYWVMRLNDNDLTHDDRQALHLWIDSDPRHGALLDSYARTWSLSRLSLKAGRKATEAADASLGRRRSLVLGSIAAACLVIAMTVFGPATRHGQADANVVAAKYETRPGLRKTIALPDGSSATLAQSSVLDIRFEKDRRYLKLDRGIAEFDVAHDPKRPFDVVAGKHIVRAVGTRFRVALEPSGELAVRVTQGKVIILDRGARPVEIAGLSAGQAVTINHDRLVFTTMRNAGTDDGTHLVETPPMRAGGRPQGGAPLTFHNERLDVIVAYLNRHSRPLIRIEGEGLGARRISGHYSGGDPTAFLEAVAESEQLELNESADQTLILTPQGR